MRYGGTNGRRRKRDVHTVTEEGDNLRERSETKSKRTNEREGKAERKRNRERGMYLKVRSVLILTKLYPDFEALHFDCFRYLASYSFKVMTFQNVDIS